MIIDELFEAPQLCPECGGISFSDLILAEKKDACYYKVKASAKVWPSAYASGRLVQCRKKGAANYGKSKTESIRDPNEMSGVNSMRKKLGNIIKQAAQDDEVAYNASKLYRELWNIYGGDIDAIIAERSIFELEKLARELVAVSKQGVAEGTGDEKFDTMMGRIQQEPKYPDPQMPPTDVKDLYQWAVKNNKPYHKIFAEWANREGFKSVAQALHKAGTLDSDYLDYWTPDIWKLYWGEIRGIDSEMPPEWAKERIPDELRDYLETVFDAYDHIVFDWPTEYRQIGQQGISESEAQLSRRGFLRGLASFAAAAAVPAPVVKMLKTPAGVGALPIAAGVALLKGIEEHLSQYSPEDDDDYWDAWEDMAGELGFEDEDAGDEYGESRQDKLADIVNLYRRNPELAAAQLIKHLQATLGLSPEEVKPSLASRADNPNDWRYHERQKDAIDAVDSGEDLVKIARLAGLAKGAGASNSQEPAPTVKHMGPVQYAKDTPALPAPAKPEFDLAPDLKQKQKVPVKKDGEQGMAEQQELDEKWSQKYKKSINCANPKGFSQRAHCAGRKKNEDVAEGVMYGAENLHVGDDVVVSGNVNLKGATGVINSFGLDKRFVVVDLYNHGRHSFHSSDVSANDYANDEHDDLDEGGDVFMPNIKDTPEYKAGFATGKLPVPHPEGTQEYASYYKGVIDRASPTLAKVGEGEQQKGADYRDPPEADYGPEYQDMVARVKKLAGLGPMKTVYDPNKRVYRNMPTAQQPQKK